MNYTFKEYKKSEIQKNHLNMGGSNPSGERIDVCSLYFTKNDVPWIGVMGEYHFSRDSRENWYRELCKMKAGGITVVATYLFWIYHEETEGEFDFAGDKDIRSFILDAKRAGLDVVIRIGPWAHGECRNGGFPEWLLAKPYELRDNNPDYLEKARIWYKKIYEQVKGLFYKDGGNIIGIQFENELVYNAEHLLELKNIALGIGFEAPIYTVTGWNSEYGAQIPVDDVVPVFGAYPEAPWTNHTDKLKPSPNYVFNKLRNDSAIGADIIEGGGGWQLPYEKYPFATCELGGGIQITHHRRPLIKPMDIYALSLVKLGSGNNLVGYYMYKGGTNKIGKNSTLNESRSSGYPNDCTILSYDFQAPISEYGEVREHYGLLNMLHMFVNDFGDILAPMEATEQRTEVLADDCESLRYCMRTNGQSGFVFVNHYQRLLNLKDIKNATIDAGCAQFPPIDICGDVSFFMPFNMNLSGNLLKYATAQPLCKSGDTYFFAAIENIAPEYKFSDGEIFRPNIGLNSALEINGIKIVTLTWEQAKYTRKLSDKVYIGESCNIYEYDSKICSAQDESFAYYAWDGTEFKRHEKSIEFSPAKITFLDVDEPFVPPYDEELNLGCDRKRSWKKISVSDENGFVEIPYQYDAAQIYTDGVMAADSFYYGVPWRVPAKLLFGKECYLVMSEMKDDFYKEF